MFLLDTNIVSELRRPERAHPQVRAWASAAPEELCLLSVVTIMELERCTQLIERRDAAQGGILRRWLDNDVLAPFRSRIITVDVEIARRAATLHMPDPRPERDALIAATALIHGLVVVTRNTADFEPTGVQLLNPWLSI